MVLQRACIDGDEVVCKDGDDCADSEAVGEVVECLVGDHISVMGVRRGNKI